MTNDTTNDDATNAQDTTAAPHSPAGAPGGPEGADGADGAATADAGLNPGNEGDDDGDHGHEVDPRLRAARKDAAGYRERLRETEAARDVAAARAAGLERAILERVNPMADHITADALITLGLDASAFISDTGAVDTDGLAAECQRIAHAAGVRPAGLPYTGSVGRTSENPPRPDDWLRHAMPGGGAE